MNNLCISMRPKINLIACLRAIKAGQSATTVDLFHLVVTDLLYINLIGQFKQPYSLCHYYVIQSYNKRKLRVK